MTATQQAVNDQTIPTEDHTSSSTRQKKDKKNLTDGVKWSIFTETETRASAVKAAKKAGLKLNEWIDTRLRQAAIAELTKKAEPPAKPEDVVTDIVKKLADQMKAEQAEAAEQQNALIREQGQQLAVLADLIKNQPAPQPQPTLKEMIFGRKKAD